LRRGGRNDPIEDGTNILHVLLQLGVETLGRFKTEAACESLERRAVARDDVDLLFCFDLQAMLNQAEKSITSIKIENLVSRNQIEPRQSLQGPERAGVLEEGISSTVNELQRLHDEFDLADSTPAELEVALH